MTLTTRCPSCGLTHAVPEADALEQGAARDRRTIEAQQAELERLRAQWAAVPWKQLRVACDLSLWYAWPPTQAAADWLNANAPKETQP